MDKETLSHYGWIVVLILILSVMLAFATPLGEYIGKGALSVSHGFVDVNNQATNKENIKRMENKWNEYLGNDSSLGKEEGGNGENKPGGGLENGGNIALTFDTGDVVPKNCIYTDKTGKKILPGQKIPQPKNGDVLTSSEYTYVYSDETRNGWNVTVQNKNKSKYGKIYETINGHPVTDMYRTFMGCSKLTVSPEIPNTIERMTETFSNCALLKTAPVLPDSVKVLDGTFSGTGISVAPFIPKNVISMRCAFSSCISLTQAPIIPNGVQDLEQTFYCCTSLKDAPEIPDSVTNMRETFSQCMALQTAPVIPKNVKSINQTFYCCVSLKGNVVINALNLENYQGCFTNCASYNTTKIILKGSCPKLQEIKTTGGSYITVA